ncbi:LOW QUALITY PROTEIN: 1-phosphatidylinositol 4,5-bisphosphate phosphodiesterase gamma-1-like [Lethenteron reissneri]|uniref:LOW QUALITY PROTEIN: 1-phosphatidylinositol 4,5-bisphosphate phosphodiesterase gamma-1-like n=1 Tax=Lethenteron reissneri TaxID=7753 RepID=UPI002AB70ADC|nr:LOW QUALITY PROTEIN: 1-phosphatidylinositol 4,5-bisphosphate phosphodiesterase gamma-1-like [Lethenteron reissneri]
MAVSLRDLSGVMLLNGMETQAGADSPGPATPRSPPASSPGPGSPPLPPSLPSPTLPPPPPSPLLLPLTPPAETVSVGGGPASPAPPETLAPACRQLRQGTSMTLFQQKKSQRPERKTFQVVGETRQVVWWSRSPDKTEGIVDIREIKEIRPGKNSRDFERYQDEARKVDALLCFVVLYGTEFRLKTLSIVADSKEEASVWVTGLNWLLTDTLWAPTALQIERWLRKQFYAMDRNRGNGVNRKDLKAMLPQLNFKLPNTRQLRDKFAEVEARKGEISFTQFVAFYKNLMFDAQRSIVEQIDFCVPLRNSERPDVCSVTLHDFQRFLQIEQKEPWASDLACVRELMFRILCDGARESEEPCFSLEEFLTYLFSRENCVWDSQYNQVCAEQMNNPLSHYWISSSHNTYLTGDQFSSESSLEAYARCLRMGCRCIELDCWDGPDDMPIIYHGHTLTSKIKFLDVLNTIKEHAFVTSDYPVVLSIEDHCSIVQQRNMASFFRKVFGDMLLIKPVEAQAEELPSPTQLKGKILIKHKKLGEGNSDEVASSGSYSECDISNSIKNGILYLEDPINHEWNPHFFVLTSNKIYYSEETTVNQSNDEEEEDDTKSQESNNNELHFSEKWFHGKLGGGRDGRQIAERLLLDYCLENGGKDGTFLVRDSETFVGDYTLSFWRSGRVQHCRIHSRQEAGTIRYFLTDNLVFDSLYSLIQHYREVPLRCNEFEMRLSDPVPQPNAHESKEWYHSSLTRAEAEHWLMRVPKDGAFLVRKRSDPSSYAITFRADGKIKHCRVQQEGRLFLLGNSAEFESLVDLVCYYEKHPLYRKMRLRYAINEETLEKLGTYELDYGALYEARNPELNYVEANKMAVSKCVVKALYDYRAQRDDELSFCKHAIITGVDKQDGGWWRGDYGGKKQLWFPSNYVEEMTCTLPQGLEEAAAAVENSPLGNFQKGMIDVTTCTVVVPRDGKGAQRYVFSVQSIHMHPPLPKPLEIAAPSLEELHEWVSKVKDAASAADMKLSEGKQMERRKKIALELSELVVYCRPVPFDEEKIGTERASFKDMSSFPETKAEKYANRNKGRKFLQYNRRQLSRVYPKGQRLDSSNYDPLPLWACGSQLVALNFQTPDKPMQLNQALFLLGGRSGYVLQPEIMRDDSFDPFDKTSLKSLEPISIQLTILAARHLPKNGRGIACPFVEVEVCGADYDYSKYKTEVVPDNGLNPVWTPKVAPTVFDVNNPEFSFLRFVVYEEDMFSDPNFLAQATFPIKGLKPGYRSVPLKNSYSEELELASLLIHIDVTNAKEEGEDDLYSSIQRLRDRTTELRGQLAALEGGNGGGGGGSNGGNGGGGGGTNGRAADSSFDACYRHYQQQLDELRATQEQLVQLTEERNTRLREKKEDRRRREMTNQARRGF